MGKAARKKRGNRKVAHDESVSSESYTTPVRTNLFNKPALHFLFIISVGILIYSNTFQVPFVFDDAPNIVENPIIKDVRYFSDPREAKGMPLYEAFKSRFIGYFTFAINYKLQGLKVTGYHTVNLLIHIMNALLVYVLVVFSFRTPSLRRKSFSRYSNPTAFLSALLFVTHPVQTQAVTYIVQRLASLATLFYLLSLVMYIRSRLSVSPVMSYSQYVISFTSAVLAMKTKEISFTLPLIITLYEFVFFNGKILKRILYVVPMLFTLLIIPLTLLETDKAAGDVIGDVSEATKVLTTMPRSEYLLTEFRVITTYIRILFLPVNQRLDYDFPLSHSLLEPGVFLSFVFLFSIFFVGLYLLYLSRHTETESAYPFQLVSFGILWFFITLSVESSVIPIVDVIFEHRVYLPSVGAFSAAATALFIAMERLSAKKQHGERVIATSCIVIIIVLSSTTYARNIIWQDKTRFWEDVVKKSPQNARAQNNLGNVYSSKGLTDKAIERFETALRIKPDYAHAYNNLGIALVSKGLTDKAIEDFQAAIRLKPDYAEAYNNLAVAQASKGLIDKAIENFQAAVRVKPDYAEAHSNLGSAYNLKGLTDKTIENFQAAVRIKPDYAEAHFKLGDIYRKKGLNDMAYKELEIVLQIDPNHRQAQQLLDALMIKNKNGNPSRITLEQEHPR